MAGVVAFTLLAGAIAGLPRVAAGGSSVYQRDTRSFQAVPLRTRGYLADACLQQPAVPCLDLGTGAYRPGGTAQARAIQALSAIEHAGAGGPLVPETQVAGDSVQWEVGPANDPDPTATDDAAADSATCPASFRIDVLTDDTGSTGQLDAYEVRSWNGGDPNAWQAARDELGCSIDQLDALYGGASVAVPGANLVGPSGARWSTAYPDNQGQVWCAWADQPAAGMAASGPGLVFYARQSDQSIPADVRAATPGCDQPTEDAVRGRCAAELMTGGLACSVTDSLGLLMLSGLFLARTRVASGPEEPVAGQGRPVVRPFAQLVDPNGVARYAISVPEAPDQALTLTMDFGDGTFTSWPVPIGPGTFSVSADHRYTPGFGLAVPRAEVLETRQQSAVFLAEDLNDVLPGFLGTPDSAGFWTNVVAGGTDDSAAADACGNVWTWGANDTGQLGYATGGAPQATPRRVPGLHLVTDVAAGNGFTIVKRQDGSMWAWGANDHGQLGNGTTLGEFDGPTLVGIGGEVAPFTIWAGRDSGIVNFADGSVDTWGGNGGGQLGDGTTIDRADPLTVVPAGPGPYATWVAAAPWTGHVLITDGNQQVLGWGDNAFGAVGTGAVGGSVTRPKALGFRAGAGIAVGGQFSISVNGMTVTTWGRNDAGQLGQGTINAAANPPATAVAFAAAFDMAVAAPAAGQDYVLLNGEDAKTLADMAVGWGGNAFGQLDTGTTANVSGPVRMKDALQFQPGAEHALGVDNPLAFTRTNDVWAWGSNVSGQVGTGTSGQTVPSSEVVLTGVNAGSGPGCQTPAAAVTTFAMTAAAKGPARAAGFVSRGGRRPAGMAGGGPAWSLRAPRTASGRGPTGRAVRRA